MYSVRSAAARTAATALTAPDRHGNYGDVALGYDSLDAYLKRPPYFGALIGRYANQIARGQSILDGNHYTLATNDGPNALHGGTVGFDKVVWTVAQAAVGSDGPQLTLCYVSRNGEDDRLSFQHAVRTGPRQASGRSAKRP